MGQTGGLFGYRNYCTVVLMFELNRVTGDDLNE